MVPGSLSRWYVGAIVLLGMSVLGVQFFRNRRSGEFPELMGSDVNQDLAIAKKQGWDSKTFLRLDNMQVRVDRNRGKGIANEDWSFVDSILKSQDAGLRSGGLSLLLHLDAQSDRVRVLDAAKLAALGDPDEANRVLAMLVMRRKGSALWTAVAKRNLDLNKASPYLKEASNKLLNGKIK